MADRTGIEWTGSTWTPIRARNRATGKLGWHCVHVSPGCKNCYAESWNKPRGTGLPFKPGHAADVEIFLDERMLLQPLRWKKPRQIFVCSMTDLFADFVPDEMIDRVFAVMALAPQHTFQVLTKRAARMRAYVEAAQTRIIRDNHVAVTANGMFCGKRFMNGWPWPLPNVWLGVSAEDQARADERVPELLATPAAVRFVSAEPLLGPIDFEALSYPDGMTVNALNGLHSDCEGGVDGIYGNPDPKLDWIIVGGESGPGARPMHPDWARSIRDQCAAAGTAFFFKQWGEWSPHTAALEDADGSIRTSPRGGVNWQSEKPGGAFGVFRVGKMRAGRLLDGVEHSAMPEVRHG